MAARRSPAVLEGESEGESRSLRGASSVSGWDRDGGLGSRVQVSEMQRSRLLAGAVGAVEQYGYAHTTVTHIANRARISRRTFYELFENREDCLAAMFESALQSITEEVSESTRNGLLWRERVRVGLWAILSFFDSQPAIARVCVVQAMRGDESVLQRRAEILRSLARVIDEGRGEGARARNVPPLTAEGLVGAAHAILYARLLDPQHEPLTGLLNALMAMIVLPYLGGDAARREGVRALPPPRGLRPADAPQITAAERNPLEVLPMRVTYRTVRVLECVAEKPGISNREVADHAGISDQGQASKLLSRLERLGLILNTGEGQHTKGEPNAWKLTPTGQKVTQSIPTHTSNKQAA